MNVSKPKPIASISLDLDNKWSYLKVRGNPTWVDFPGYFPLVVPRILEFLKKRSQLITFFVVGQDAALECNHESLGKIGAAGHEIGNHTFHHEPWLHLYTRQQLTQEFEVSEAAIEQATGQKSVGFRGPGFSCSRDVLRTLMHRGYLYDGSTFPTSLGPVARAYYFLNAGFSSEQKEERKELFGSFKDAFQPNQPFVWTEGEQRLVEIPVTTMPLSRVPIHVSYLNFLGAVSPRLAKLYFWKAMTLCKLTGMTPSLLLHPLDFMGQEDDEDMAFFPGMNQSADRKIELLSDCLDMMACRYEIVTMRGHAQHVLSQVTVERPIESAAPGVPVALANET